MYANPKDIGGKIIANTAVTVRDLTAEQGLAGHMRAPLYCRGKSGIVERCVGLYPNPEGLAYGKDGQPAQALYRVRFRQAELWSDYTGPSSDTIDIEIYEHWLKEA